MLFFVRALRIEKCVSDTPIVREDDEPVRIFIEPAERKNALDGQNFFYFFLVLLRGVRDDAARLVVCKVTVLGLPPFQLHLVALRDLVAQDRRPTVDRDKSFLDDLVRLTPRAVLLLREVFIDTMGNSGLSVCIGILRGTLPLHVSFYLYFGVFGQDALRRVHE